MSRDPEEQIMVHLEAVVYRLSKRQVSGPEKGLALGVISRPVRRRLWLEYTQGREEY